MLFSSFNCGKGSPYYTTRHAAYAIRAIRVTLDASSVIYGIILILHPVAV